MRRRAHSLARGVTPARAGIVSGFGRTAVRSVQASAEAMAFDLQPTLTGKLLRLRPLLPDDFDDLFAVASDPLIWEQHPMRDRYKEEVFRGFFSEALASGGALIAIDSGNGRVIGSSRFHGYHETASEIEIGWTFLARLYWGGAYNREMKELMLRHAFRFVSSVIFLVGPENVRSQRAMEKIGGTLAGSKCDASGRESLIYRIADSQLPRSARRAARLARR